MCLNVTQMDVWPSLAAFHLFEQFHEFSHHSSVVVGHVGLLLSVIVHVLELWEGAVAGLNDRAPSDDRPSGMGRNVFPAVGAQTDVVIGRH